jgi:hypothetical protein
VESLEFIDGSAVRRCVSVDFEVPKDLPDLEEHAAPDTWLVPISVIPKWPPLMSFTFIGPDEHPTSLYRRATNNRLDHGLVLGMADLALKETSSLHRTLSADLQEKLLSLISADLASSDELEQVAWRLESELQSSLSSELAAEQAHGESRIARQIAATTDLVGQLSASSVLWVPVAGRPGTDRIVKFSYLDPYVVNPTRAHARRSLLGIASAWRKLTLAISLPHVGTRTRFHLDVPAPPGGLRLVSADVIGMPSSGAAPTSSPPVLKSLDTLAAEYVEIDGADEYVGAKSSREFLDYGVARPEVLASSSDRDARRVIGPEHVVTSVRLCDSGAHVYLGAGSAPSHRVLLQVKLGVARQGFMTACMLVAFALAALMTAAFVMLEAAARHLDATVVLFSIVPLVLGYIVVRPDEGAMERMQISGIRMLAVLAGALPIAGALALVLSDSSGASSSPDLSVAEPVWIGLLVISWAVALALLASWQRASKPPPSE